MEISKTTKHKYIKYGCFIGIVPIFFLIRYYYLNDPESNSTNSFFPSCIFHLITGYHCPGCGSQRAIHDLLNGRFIQALQHNALFLILASVIGIKLYYFIAKKIIYKKAKDLTYNKYFTYSILIIIISYWVLRNIDTAPFCYMAP